MREGVEIDTIESRIDLLDGAFWGRNPHEELAWLRATRRYGATPQ